jgi:CRP-like cAMP-binding protein
MTSSSEKIDSYQSSEFQENLEILRQIFFFSSIPLEKLKIFAYICKREIFKKDEHIFKQGEDDGQALYILSGKAKLIRTDEDIEEEIRDYESGVFLGGITLLSDNLRFFSLKAQEETTCLIITREKFQSALQQYPEVIPRIIMPLLERISSWEGRVLDSREKGCQACRNRLGVSLI